MPECNICHKNVSLNDSRFGTCWDCADAESIIEEGRDMDGNGITVITTHSLNSGHMEKHQIPASSARERLEFLIKKGWRKSELLNTKQ